ncbi:MAG: DUF2093 domain-containing protein [Pseudomonadota bacterium]
MLFGKKQAKLIYTLSGYRVASPGDFVLCAVTGKQIALEELRYWNEDRQEAYADAHAASARKAQEDGA